MTYTELAGTYEMPTAFVLAWVTEDGKKDECSIPNLDPVAKWFVVERMVDVMRLPQVIEVADYRVYADGTRKRGNLSGMVVEGLRRNRTPSGFRALRLDPRETLALLEKHEMKFKEALLP